MRRASALCLAAGLSACASLPQVEPLLGEATLAIPADTKFLSTGRRGVHSEHLGYVLAEMQFLQRAYPGARW